MIKKPKISVVMTVYNAGIYLSETIESILNQTFKDFELIIVNDKSTDDSLETIREFMKNDNRIVLINNKKNAGPTTSLNIGLENAKGKYIAISDHDDISLPERLEIEYNFLEDNQDIFLVGGGAININENGKKISMFKPITDIKKINKKMSYINCFYHPTVMYKNQGKPRYRDKIYYAHDRDFYLNLLSEHKKITNISNILVKYRVHSNQLSVSKRVNQYLFAQKAKEFYEERIKRGKDSYDSFNPKEILEFDINKHNNPSLLKVEADSNFALGKYKKAMEFYKKYIILKGFFNKSGIKYILSKLGNKSLLFHNLNRLFIRILT